MEPSFCKDCGALVEWHVTRSGKRMPLDPDPHPNGNFRFGAGLRLESAAPGTARRMYRCHWDTCSKKGAAPRRAAFVCERDDCSYEGEHLHCFRCGSTDHLANNCEEES